MDKVSNGERISEIRLPAAGERVAVNHDLRLAVRGSLDGNWPVPASRALTVQPVTPAPPVSPAVFPPAARIRGARSPAGPGAAGAASAAAGTTVGVARSVNRVRALLTPRPCFMK